MSAGEDISAMLQLYMQCGSLPVSAVQVPDSLVWLLLVISAARRAAVLHVDALHCLFDTF